MGAITGRAICPGGGGTAKPDFTYTGNYQEREDGVIELLSSGVFTANKKFKADLFGVGGGGRGGMSYWGSNYGSGGGGGGYVVTVMGVQLSGAYTVIIGEGASGTAAQPSGGTTTFGDLLTAAGGQSAYYGDSNGIGCKGGNGGSGGGGGSLQRAGATGGSNGANGDTGYIGTNSCAGGTGQGTTTYEFGDPAAKAYGAGGGGASGDIGGSGGAGGTTGGGKGGYCYGTATVTPGTSGEANTGGGGGGGAYIGAGQIAKPGDGGSGIICIRLAA